MGLSGPVGGRATYVGLPSGLKRPAEGLQVDRESPGARPRVSFREGPPEVLFYPGTARASTDHTAAAALAPHLLGGPPVEAGAPAPGPSPGGVGSGGGDAPAGPGLPAGGPPEPGRRRAGGECDPVPFAKRHRRARFRFYG